MKILIVHDSKEKTSAIKELLSHSFTEYKVEEVNNASDARDKLASYEYDLLILDLHLPENSKSEARPEAGYNLLIEISSSARLKCPVNLLGITSKSDLIEKYKNLFEEHSHQLINSDSDWKNVLANKLRYISKTLKQSDLKPLNKKIDICVLTALEEELEPYFKFFPEHEKLSIPGDPILYYESKVKTREGKELSIVFCTLATMGISSTATIATKLIYTFVPNYLCITGICAGFAKDVNLGDLLITEKSFDYSAGKIVEQENGEFEFKPSNTPYVVPAEVKQIIVKAKSDRALMDKSLNLMELDNELKRNYPTVHLGPTSTGPFVVESKKILEMILSIDRKVLGLDMETFALFNSVHYFNDEIRPKVLSIKGVCDAANLAKNDKYHKYSSFLSAYYLLNLFENGYFNS